MLQRSNLLKAGSALALVAAVLVGLEVHGLPSLDELPYRLAACMDAGPSSTWVPLWAISPKLQAAVVLWEDPQFYFHHGLAYDEMERAFLEDLRTRSYARGGSTITQQIAKNLFLTKDKTLRRKFDEAILAKRMERRLSKQQLLEVYLNIADWGTSRAGEPIAGAEAAARYYFHKSAADMTWAEAAMLAAMLANPHRINPSRDPQRVLRLRQAVLRQLLNDGDIEEYDFRQASAESLPEHRP